MALLKVIFQYRTGLNRPIFRNPRLTGSWDEEGRYSDTWSTVPMRPFLSEDGCSAWIAEVAIDGSQLGWWFHWGVVLDSPHRVNIWGIPTEFGPANSAAQHLDFRFERDGQIESYWFTNCRRLGANKHFHAGAPPAACFSVWAPNAQKVEVVIGETASGYIWPDGRGVQQAFAMRRDDWGIWHTNVAEEALADFTVWDHKPYMYRVIKDDGLVSYRTDLYSRCQIGSGKNNPEHSDPNAPWDGTRQDLDGSKSCSVVVDPERVTKHFSEPNFPENEWLSEDEFWANEYDPLRPIPSRVEDLVIYELHIGALGLGKEGPGTLEDGIALLDHLVDLGVNAVELLPMSEYEGWASWGYGTSHYFAIEYAGGGRDQFKFFVRECHRRGIAVILDVVYNHYTHDGERAEWMYDTNADQHNGYYWYEGHPSNWPTTDGGYLDNGSTGYTPNFREEIVRKMMISSAAALIVEFHVDGFRMDLTQAIHRDNVIHANGNSVPEANAFGARFMREWVRTLRLIKPGAFLLAEDHTGWDAITQPQETGGIGFDATWWTEWYHHVIGDATNDGGKARLLKKAGQGGDFGLPMGWIADTLLGTPRKVIFHESHDEAGNSSYQEYGQEVHSARTIMVAVNGMLSDNTRPWAEARTRVATGLTILASGTPMFFMGEEVGAAKPYRYNDFLSHREDILALRRGSGTPLFRFYQDLIRLRRRAAAFRSPNVEILHTHDDNRVLAFRRWWGDEEFLIIFSLRNQAFNNGYGINHEALGEKSWVEVLNSDADLYGGKGVCNPGRFASSGGKFNVNLPANGFAVFQKL